MVPSFAQDISVVLFCPSTRVFVPKGFLWQCFLTRRMSMGCLKIQDEEAQVRVNINLSIQGGVL